MPAPISKNTLQSLIELRHQLHQLAELSGREQQTAEHIKEFLQETNPSQLLTGIGGEGIVATYDSGKEGPHVLLRCELDGLPIADNIDADYQSQADGVGHKCGHDGHMAILCGVATLLAEVGVCTGKVSLLFQPAEETGEGAKRVVEDENFKHFSFDYCFALHNLPGFPKGQIVLKNDTFAAASVGMKVRYRGATAHAAHPEEGTSPALAVAQTIASFSAVPQYYVPLEEAAKVTVIHASVGEQAFGTSPGQGKVMATLRTYDDELLEKLKSKCIQIAEGHAQTYNLAMEVDWVEPFPATVNAAEAVEVITSAASDQKLEVHQKQEPFSWSEDFGHFTRKYKGAMFGLGAGEDQPALHAESYDFPDEVIQTGIQMFMQIIKEVTETHE